MVTTPTPAVQPPSGKTIANKWWGKIRLYVAVIGVGLQVYAVYALKMSLDLLTGVALITLLFMMLQTEHERCDRVRAGWREVRRTTFTTTSAVQWAKKKQGLAVPGDESGAAEVTTPVEPSGAGGVARATLAAYMQCGSFRFITLAADERTCSVSGECSSATKVVACADLRRF